MSPNSKSFARYKEFITGIGTIHNDFLRVNSKEAIKEYLIRFGYDEREVLYAENLDIKTKNELQSIKKAISSYVNKRMEDIGQVSNGIIDLHPQGDKTSKHAHIHYWGENSALASQFISEFIHINGLTNKSEENLSYGFMEAKGFYRIDKSGVVHDIKNKTFYEETDLGMKAYDAKTKEQIEIAKLEEVKLPGIYQEFDSTVDHLDNILNELERMTNVRFEYEESIQEFSLDDIDKIFSDFDEQMSNFKV